MLAVAKAEGAPASNCKMRLAGRDSSIELKGLSDSALNRPQLALCAPAVPADWPTPDSGVSISDLAIVHMFGHVFNLYIQVAIFAMGCSVSVRMQS